MLKSDGLRRDQFMPLWRDQMWEAGHVDERTRLALELGRLEVRETGKAAPLLVAYVEALDTPFVVMHLEEAPTASAAPERRAALRLKLGELGATEAYTVVTLAAGERDGIPSFLLVAWGETSTGLRACWMAPFRWHGKRLEEAMAMQAPDPDATVVARELAGLLPPRH